MHRVVRFLLPGFLAWGFLQNSDAMAQFLNQAGFGAGGIGVVQAGTIGPPSVESKTGGSPPVLHPLTEEFRDVTARTPPAGGAATEQANQRPPQSGESTSTDRLVKRQGYVRLHTMRLHPQPNLRNATAASAPVDPHDSPSAAAVRGALSRVLEGGFDFEETPLRAVLSHIAEQARIPVVPDMQALTDAGIDIDATTITHRLAGVSLRSALRHILREPGLTYLIKDDVLLITTRDKAQENLVISIYPLVAWTDARELVGTIQDTVARDTWDTVGGQGSIRFLPEANCLVISQTQEVHEDISALLSRLSDGSFGSRLPEAPDDPAAIPTRVYPVRDEKTLPELQQKLVAVCNAALGAAGDPEATVSTLAGRLVVQSRKRSFHAYAAEMIRAIDGVDVTVPEYFGVNGASSGVGVNSGMNMMGPGAVGGNAFCWVAREVYGTHDPRWLTFRGWMLTEAPTWLRAAYGRHGEVFSQWLHDKPVARATVRRLMDLVVEAHDDAG